MMPTKDKNIEKFFLKNIDRLFVKDELFPAIGAYLKESRIGSEGDEFIHESGARLLEI